MRVYIPGSVSQLKEIAAGLWEPTHAFAATERMLELVPQLDPDEVADEVIHAAAMHSALQMHSPLRVVVAADVPRADVAVERDAHPASVAISGRLTRDAIACVFVDEPHAEQDAAGAIAGDESAQERLAERDLLWYDASEIEGILLV